MGADGNKTIVTDNVIKFPKFYASDLIEGWENSYEDPSGRSLSAWILRVYYDICMYRSGTDFAKPWFVAASGPSGRIFNHGTISMYIHSYNNLNDADDEASLLLLSLINSWPFADPIDETVKELHEFHTFPHLI